MSQLKDSLIALADTVEALQNQPAPKPQINDRSLSGNKINGGKITNFSSVGIKDNSTYAGKEVLFVENDRIIVPAIETSTITTPLTVQGNLTVEGEVHARKLHVDEISADVRNERTTPLEFKAENGSVTNKGLLWTGSADGRNRQLTMQSNPERLYTSENFDINRERSYQVGGFDVLSSTTLGAGVKHSSLTRVGTLERLDIAGALTIDSFVYYDPDSMRLGIGTETPNGMFSVKGLEHEFVVDYTEDLRFSVGTWTTSGLDIITDDTKRISIAPTGEITVNSKTSFNGKIGVGVKNFGDDADITSAGPIRFQNKKFQTGSEIPQSGSYRKGDIIWNTDPKPTSYVGWVCTKDGTPGSWKPFGQIAS